MNLENIKNKRCEIIIILMSVIFGLFLWILDSTLDYLIFNRENLGFLNILALRSGQDKILNTLLYLVTSLTAGIIASILFGKNRSLNKHLQHSTRTLKALKEINQIILFENDIKKLIKKSCETLTETGGFDIVWFIDSNGKLFTWADKPNTYKNIEIIKNGNFPNRLPKCINEAFISKKMEIRDKLDPKCMDCSLREFCTNYSLASMPLVFNKNIYGVLCAVTPVDFGENEDGHRLLEEVAEDMALALHLLESESYKKQIEKKWTQLIETTTDAVVSVTEKGIVTAWNPGAEKMTGYKEDEIIGKSIDIIETEEDRKKHRKHLKYAFEFNDTRPYETIIRTQKNKKIPVEVSITFDRDRFGKLTGISGIIRDISERKKNEKLLAFTRERLELAMDAGQHGFWDWDLKKNEIYFSPGFFLMLDYKPDELPMDIDTWFSLIHPDDKKRVIPRINEFISVAQNTEMEFRMLSKFRSWRWISSRVKTFDRDENDLPLRVVGVHIDISEQKKNEKNLKAMNERLDLVIKGTRAGLWDWNVVTGEAYFNERWAEIAGYTIEELEPVSIHTWLDLCHHEDLKKSNELMKKHFSLETDFYSCEVRIRHKKGYWVWVQSRGMVVSRDENNNPIRVTGTQIDINQRKEEEAKRQKLTEQLRQSGKMEAVGKLAGGVAHDFNNMLQIIQGYSDLLMDISKKDSTEFEFSMEISKSVDKASKLTKQLLAFSRQQVLVPRIFSIKDSVKNIESLVSRTMEKKIVLKSTCPEHNIYINADQVQIEHALLNLCLNSKEAMENGGTLKISTSEITIDKKVSPDLENIPPGSYALITIEDTGAGIDKDIINKIFDPFFTTRKKATGLGLSTVYGIVKQHRGYIQVKSSQGNGSLFALFFPLARPVEEKNQEISHYSGKEHQT